MSAGEFDVADTRGFGGRYQCRTLLKRAGVVRFNQGIGVLDPGVELRGEIVCRFGQRVLTAKRLVGPPTRQAFANGRRPDRVEPVRQVPEQIAAAQPAPLERYPIDTEVSVPTPHLIQANRLLIGFLAGAGQSPVS